MRTGRYHYRYHPFQSKSQISHGDVPVSESSYSHHNCYYSKPFGYFIRQILSVRLCCLRILNQINDLIEVESFPTPVAFIFKAPSH
jgi:hypothetical protein